MTNAIRDNNHVTVALGVSSTDATITVPFKVDPVTGRLLTDASGSGYTNLTQFIDQTAWRVFYSDGSGDVQELALGAADTVLTSNGATSAPTFEAASGSKPNKEYFWPASATLPLEASADRVAPISKLANTVSFDELVVAFDSAGTECRTVNFRVPPDVTTGNIDV